MKNDWGKIIFSLTLVAMSAAISAGGAFAFQANDSDEAAAVNDRDAAPRVRYPPRYPQECFAGAKNREAVLVEFDVTPDGKVANARVIDTTNACLNESALAVIQKWRYRAAYDSNGERRWRRGVQTVVTYELAE